MKSRPERHARPGLAQAFAVGGFLAALAMSGARAEAPLTLVYETRLTVEVRLVLDGPRGESLIRTATISGLPDEPLVFSDVLEVAPDSIAVGVVVVAHPQDDTGNSQLHLETSVKPRHGAIATVERDVTVDSGRLLLTEIWSNETQGRRLMLALITNWEKVPTLTGLVPGREPLEVVVELFLGHGAGSELVERHRLGGVVGSPVNYTFRQVSGSTATEESDSDGRLSITVLPIEIVDGKVDLDVKLRHAGTSPYSKLASMNLALRERLSPGYSVSLPLPQDADSPPLTFRITPYF